MNEIIASLIMILCALLAAVSQTMLKRSADIKYESQLKVYLNPLVMGAYGLLGLTMVLNIVAYGSLPYKLGPILNASSYVFVMLLGRVVLKEKFTFNKIAGNVLIIVGILVFSWQ